MVKKRDWLIKRTLAGSTRLNVSKLPLMHYSNSVSLSQGLGKENFSFVSPGPLLWVNWGTSVLWCECSLFLIPGLPPATEGPGANLCRVHVWKMIMCPWFTVAVGGGHCLRTELAWRFQSPCLMGTHSMCWHRNDIWVDLLISSIWKGLVHLF